jgi:hypothetical protein
VIEREMAGDALYSTLLDLDTTGNYSRPDVFPFAAIGQPEAIKR